MKILSFLNLSNPSNLLADSGFIFQIHLLEELQLLDCDILFVCPHGSGKFINVKTLEMDFPHDKYSVRFAFNFSELFRKLNEVNFNPDILLVNQAEITVNLSAVLSVKIGKKIPTITYFHYLPIIQSEISGFEYDKSLDDLNLGEQIWGQHVNAAKFSEACIIGSHWGRNFFISSTNKTDRVLIEKFHVIPPPVSKEIFDTALRELPRGGQFRIIYNHRLYGHYGTDKLLEWIAEYSKCCSVEIKLLITNPTATRDKVRNALDGSVNLLINKLQKFEFVEIIECQTRLEYYNLISSAHIGLSPMRSSPLWSMAIIDVMALGRPVIAFDTGAYGEIIKDKDLMYGNKSEFFKALDLLIRNENIFERKALEARENSKGFSANIIASKFKEIFESLYSMSQ